MIAAFLSHRITHRQVAPYVILGLLVLLAGSLRIVGHDWGLPFRLHPDEWKYVFNAVRAADGEFDTQYYKNPTGYTYLLALLFRIIPFPVLDRTAWYQEHPEDFYVIARLATACLGTLTVALVYGIARFNLSRQYALAAAAIYSVSFLSVRDSHFAVNDIPLTFFISLSLFLFHRYEKSPASLWIVLAGLSTGFTIGVKYTGFVLCASILLYFLLHRDHKAWRDGFQFLFCTGLGFLLAVPGFLFSFQTFWHDFLILMQVSKQPSGYSEAVNLPFAYASALYWGFGILPLFAALMGLILRLISDGKRSIVLASFFTLYSLLLLTTPLFFSRFTLPLIPLLSIYAAQGIEALSKPFRSTIPWILAWTLCLCGESALRSIQLLQCIHQPDTRVLALNSIRDAADSGKKIVADPLSLPYIHHGSMKTYPSTLLIVDYNRSPITEIEAYFSMADWILVSDFATHAVGLKNKNEAWKTYLDGKKVRAVYLSGTAGSPITEDEVSLPFQSVGQRERPGPEISIYVGKVPASH